MCFYFFDLIEIEKNHVFSKLLINSANKKTRHMFLAYQSLRKIPQPILITTLNGEIEFSNEECIKLIGLGSLDSRNINQVFLTFQPNSSNESIASVKLFDQSLRMFKLKTIFFESKTPQNNIYSIENIDFNFQDFCKGIVSKCNFDNYQIFGLLDHNFAIYRMSPGWSELLKPIDKFFHSGLIWDKLKILSIDEREIKHLENSIATASNSTAWLNLKSGMTIKVSLEKLYAPDYRHFYLFSAKISEDLQKKLGVV
tara:strand:+ start:146 stop:910 length:765 start_codon:yes stop_codon:yes gene_type:complete